MTDKKVHGLVGKKKSLTHIRNIRKALRGRNLIAHLTPEQEAERRRKIKEAWKLRLTPEQEERRRQKVERKSKPRIPWNKGIKNFHSKRGLERKRRAARSQWLGVPKPEEQRKKMSLAQKGRKYPGRISSTSFKKGQSPWNKGLIGWNAGETNPRWKGGISSEYDKARSVRRLFDEWREAVYKRDNFTCQHCGSTSRLRAHHLQSFVEYPELRYTVDNGITLCISCHPKEHQRLTSFLL